MPDRVATIVVLAEDLNQVNLVRRYVQRAVHPRQDIRVLPLSGGRGAAEKFVRRRYAQEVVDCRRRATRTRTVLIVVIDADRRTVPDRASQLAGELEFRRVAPPSPDEPIAVLIPKRNVETWIYCLIRRTVNEDEDYSQDPPDGSQITKAGRTAFEWSRANAEVPADCVASLRASFVEWRKIG